MLQHHSRPADAEVSRLTFHFQPGKARRCLRRLGRQHNAPFGRPQEVLKIGRHVLQHVIGVDVSNHNEYHVLRDIPFTVERHDVVPSDALHHGQIANGRMAHGMFGIDQRLDRFVEHPLPIGLTHLDSRCTTPISRSYSVWGNGRPVRYRRSVRWPDRFFARDSPCNRRCGRGGRRIGTSAQPVEQTLDFLLRAFAVEPMATRCSRIWLTPAPRYLP